MRRKRQLPKWILLALAAAACVPWLGCATNPATGKSQIMLISEQQEIELGQREDENTVAQFGLYDSPQLQDYVEEIGLALAGASERPNLPWSFKVLDDPVVNAMALPGGYVYLTRGILTHLNSEAELATVLGHEIGHVTARHSANQMSKAQLAGLGLGIGMMVDPGVAGLSEIAQMGTQVLFLKFSRDDERQADELGLRYLIKDSYDPRESPQVFDMLRRVSAQSQQGGVPGWMSTHPDPENRSTRMRQLISSDGSNFADSRVARRRYLHNIDGLVFGENPREGFFEESRFVHPDLAFQLDFPDGWGTRNTKEMVAAVGPNQDVVVYLILVPERRLEDAAKSFSRQQGVSVDSYQRGEFNGLSAVWAGFSATVGQSPVSGRVAFVELDGKIFRLLGYTRQDLWSRYGGTIDRSVQSFARLQDRTYLSIQPRRIEIVELDAAMTLAEFDQRYPSSVSLDQIMLINNATAKTRFERGELVKRVMGGPSGAP
ncbi:MAG: M48 family metalloprotease [Acidobacteriota bacterium]